MRELEAILWTFKPSPAQVKGSSFFPTINQE